MNKIFWHSQPTISRDDINVVTRQLTDKQISFGSATRSFEAKIAEYVGARHALATVNGTQALYMALKILGCKKGDEVINPSYVCANLLNAVIKAECTPVLCDVDNFWVMGTKQVKKVITSKTKAIIAVNAMGIFCDIPELSKFNIPVIEDACQNFGGILKGKKAGNHGIVGVYSFHAIKCLTTGEGGMALTNRKDFYDKLVMFRSHGITRDCGKLVNKKMPRWFYEMQFLGFNYRITDIQCALGISQLKKLNRFVALRKAIVERYKEAFGGIAGISCLAERPYAKSSWHIFPILVKNGRDKIFEKLMTKNIGVNLHYIPIYLHPYYKKLGYKKGLCPMAEKYYREAITLPLYPSMSDNEVRRVISVTKTVINSL